MECLLISIEPWDGVWRRNQHLAAALLNEGRLSRLALAGPMRTRAQAKAGPIDGLSLLTPGTLIPKRAGGIRVAGLRLKALARSCHVVWVNEPTLGVRIAALGVPVVYDVTDDWRTFGFPERIRRRIRRAEDALARSARTVVCSQRLRDLWHERYGVDAAVVNNGIDTPSWLSAVPIELDGPGPHVGYIGTLHQDRLDIDLVVSLAESPAVGTLHLVGPDAMDVTSRARLAAVPNIVLHGPVPAADVPAWTLAMDVLVSPHRLSDFTLSLDAIKSREYVVSGRPVVATPTSGFQLLDERTVTLADARDFAEGVARAAELAPSMPRVPAPRPEWSWEQRAREFHQQLVAATESRQLRV